MSMISQCKELNALTGISKKTEDSKSEKSPKRSADVAQTESAENSSNKKKKKKQVRTEQENTEESFAQSSIKYEPPIVDASGLFSIDTNPTPVSFGQTESKELSSKNKRARQPRETVDAQTIQDNTDESSQRATKRAKTDHESINGKTGLEEDSADEAERQMAARLKAKDEKQAQKANKKRKRASGASEVDQQGQDDGAKAVPLSGSGVNDTGLQKVTQSASETASRERPETHDLNDAEEKLKTTAKKVKIDAEKDDETIIVDVGASNANEPSSMGLASTKDAVVRPTRKKGK